MKNVRFGLREKFIIAFVVMAIIPLVIVMYFATQQGHKIQKLATDFNQHNIAMAASFDTYVQQLQQRTDATLAWVEDRLSPLDESVSTDVAAYLKKDFVDQSLSLHEISTQIQDEHGSGTARLISMFNERQLFFLITIAIVALMAAAAAFVMGELLTRPILQLAESARKMAQGDFDDLIHIRAKDEIGFLSSAFVEVSNYMKEMAAIAHNIAAGNLSRMPPPKSSRDLLGTAFHTMDHYLRNISDFANHIANGDLASPIQVQSSEDLLGNAFEKMSRQLSETLHQIKEEVHIIEQASENAAHRSEQDMKMVVDVLSSAEETSSSMMQMQASVEEVSENMKSLAMAIEETVTSIEEMTMAIKHIAANSTGLSSSAEATFGVIQEIGEAIERLVETSNQAESSSREASESAHAGQVSVREIIEGMEVINHAVSTAGEMIKVLESRSEEIGSITNVITDIADQTSLLALNASIIAAQAGEHGRGFAVVAEEVKDLANRSSNAAKEIGELIKGVQSESQKAVESMEKGHKAVETGVQLAYRGGEALDAILLSVEKALSSIAENTRTAHEQAQLSEQVRKYMETVVGMVNEIVRSTDEQQQGAAQITQAVSNMRNLSEQVNRATTEQTRGTHHVLEAMDSVTMRVQESSNRAQELARFSADLARETHTLMELLMQFDIGDQQHAIVYPPSSQTIQPTAS